MDEVRRDSEYVLGNSDSEHARLIRQGEALAPITERLFREAGISAGQRVLDVGSGVGDVALLVGKLVTSSGEVVGIDKTHGRSPGPGLVWTKQDCTI
jgi:cyclopropane fatty-acyl-phospholipid synthase-like methyltransferase